VDDRAVAAGRLSEAAAMLAARSRPELAIDEDLNALYYPKTGDG
jgi:hypothetical protein